ncbi:hypothetical protein HDU87_003582 [Geranomyces variabilis]|uniref:Uncharacterized protein n=1 Tax=Geranomyces variabilis TaxID=109894 RepID=A0AAD5TJM8_9FUNG|nr:hypothetical protein HDU87_003582 [Geranomyces variabilis]
MDSPHYSLEDFEAASNGDIAPAQQQEQAASESALYASDFDLPPNSTRPSASPSATSRQRQNASNRSNSKFANSQQTSASALYASDFNLPSNNSTRPSAPPSATSRQRQNVSTPSNSNHANSQQQASVSALYASDFDLPANNSTRPSAPPNATSRQRQNASNRSSRSLVRGDQARDELEYEDDSEIGSSRDVDGGVGLRSSGSGLRRPESGGVRPVDEELRGIVMQAGVEEREQIWNVEGSQNTSDRKEVFAEAANPAVASSEAVDLESQPSDDHDLAPAEFGRGEDNVGMVVAERLTPPSWSEPQQLEQSEADTTTDSSRNALTTHESSPLAYVHAAAEMQPDKSTVAAASTDAAIMLEQQQQGQEQLLHDSSPHLMDNAITPLPQPPLAVQWTLNSDNSSGEAAVKKKPRARALAKASAKEVIISLPSPTPSPPPLSARKRPGYRERIRAAHASVPSHITHPRASHHSSFSPAPGGASTATAAGGGSDAPPTRAARHEQTLQEQADLEADRQRVQAIVDLLERKRAEFREQKRVEVEEHAARARTRRERLDARHERAQAEAEELTRTTLAAYHKLYPRTDPLTHRNAIPADWTSTLWYREAVEQAHHRLPGTRNKPHPHCTAMLPAKLGHGLSSDVVFGRLLTPGVRAFRAPEEGEDEDEDYDQEEMAAIMRATRFARHAPMITLPPIPIPSMPSLDLSIRLSGESEELYETAELGKKHAPAAAKYHNQFTRMSENIIRNKETVSKLLAHKPPLFGTNFASAATPDDDLYGDGTGGADGALKLSIHDLAEGGGADTLFADRGYEIHVRRVGTSGGGGGEAEQQQLDATVAVNSAAGGGGTQSALSTHMQLSSAGILRSAPTGFTVQAAEQLTRDIVSGSRRGSVAVKELLTTPVAPSPASFASALAASWQRRPSSVNAKPIMEEAATATGPKAAEIAGPAEILHEESEPEADGDEQTEGNATPPDDDGGDINDAPAQSRSRSASTSRSLARSSSAAASASSSSQNNDQDEDDDDSQQGFDESDEESTSRLFDTSRARTPFSGHYKASSSMQSSAFSRRLTSASTEGSAVPDSRASSLARGRSASTGGFSSTGSIASGNGDGAGEQQQQQQQHHRRGRRRQREVSKLAAAAGPTSISTSPTREENSTRGTKPPRQNLMPLTLDEVIAWEGLKIMQPVVRIQRKMWTVV